MGLILLTAQERAQVETIIDNIEKVVFDRGFRDSDDIFVGKINYVFSDGYDACVDVFIATSSNNNLAEYCSNLEYIEATFIPWEIVDGAIYINKKAMDDLFCYKTCFSKEDRQVIRSIIKHELVHAKDPSVNHHYRSEYTIEKEEDYYGSFAELKAYTGEFVDSLDSLVDEFVCSMEKDPIRLNILQEVLRNILNVFAGKEKYFLDETINFYSTGVLHEGYRKMHICVADKLDYIVPIMWNWKHLRKIKEHNPIGYKRFLCRLFVHFSLFEDKINRSIEGDKSLAPIKIVIEKTPNPL